MQYNTRDIVTRARQLADLENSDFISYNENIQLLNETYQQVYQKLINHGDKAFLKKLVNPVFDTDSELPENAIAIVLPPDFYQLAGVTRAKVKLPISRRAKNQDPRSLSYELINDELIVYMGSNLDDLEITYYPTPCSLYLNKDKVPFIIPDTVDASKILATGHHCVLYYDDSKNVRLYDLNMEEDTVVYTYVDNPPFAAYIESPSLVSIIESDQIRVYNLLSGSTVTYPHALHLVSDSGTFILGLSSFDADKYIYNIHKLLGETFVFDGECFLPKAFIDAAICLIGTADVDELGLTSVSLIHPTTVQGNSATYWLSYVPVNTVDEPAVIYPVAIQDDTTEVPFYASSGNIWFCDDTGLKCNGEIVPFPGCHVIGVDTVNYDTGLGVVLVDKAGDFWLGSPFPDTVLQFPQNFYYTYLAYSLAVSYGVKQQKDVSLLAGELQRIEDTFYDTLERDDNAPVRIANVYRR